MRSKTDFQANVVLKFDLFAIIVVAYIMERDMDGFVSTKKVYYGLDILKFVMAFVVVSIHARLFDEFKDVFDFVNPFKMVAVPVFFVISSFLFFSKVLQDNGKSKLHHYLKRIGTFYLFWFVVMLPMTIVVRKYYIHFDILRFIRSFFLSSTFRGSWFLMSLAIGVPVVFYMKKAMSTMTALLVCLFIYIVCQYIMLFDLFEMGGAFLKFKGSFFVHLIWISLGAFFAEYRLNKLSFRHSLFILILLYPFMLPDALEPVVRIFFVSILFMAFKNMDLTTKPYYVKMRQMSILIYVVHFFYNSGYFYIAENICPFMNNSILHFFTISFCAIATSWVILCLRRYRCCDWLKYGI